MLRSQQVWGSTHSTFYIRSNLLGKSPEISGSAEKENGVCEVKSFPDIKLPQNKQKYLMMEQIVKTYLEMPEKITCGLVHGTLKRTGSVVREHLSGKIVAHLREASLMPQHILETTQSTLLGFNAVPSLLNLGATVAFGFATILKLNKISRALVESDRNLGKINRKLYEVDRKLAEIQGQLGQIQWSIDCVYTIARSAWLESIEIRQILGDSIHAELLTASDLAQKAQLLEPDSNKRFQMLILAQSHATHAHNQIKLNSEREIEKATHELSRRRDTGKYRELLPNSDAHETLRALRSFRNSIKSASLKCLIGAEAGFIDSEVASIHAFVRESEEILKEFGYAFFRPQKLIHYDYFLNPYCGIQQRDQSKRISGSRLARLASKVDPEANSLDSILELLQKAEYRDYHPLNSDTRGWNWIVGLSEIFFELESAFEDHDRLSGHLAELEFCSQSKISIQDYRSKYEVNELPEVGSLVYFCPTEASTGMN